MLRKVVATLAGIVVAFVVISLVHLVSARFYPVPQELMHDRAAMNRHIATLPIGAFLFVLAAYALGTVAGVLTATRIGRSPVPGYVVGAFLLAGSVLNLTMYRHPVWFAVANIAIVIGATYGLTRTFAPRAAEQA